MVTLLVLVAGAMLLARREQGAHAAEQQASVARGQALFHGQTELTAHLVGHDLALPVSASRCVNCHANVEPAAATRAASAGLTLEPGPIGPALNLASLTTARSRRGAPPSRFDAASLCQALRTGVDPAQVMLPDRMPRYRATDRQCLDLWAYLIAR